MNTRVKRAVPITIVKEKESLMASTDSNNNNNSTQVSGGGSELSPFLMDLASPSLH